MKTYRVSFCYEEGMKLTVQANNAKEADKKRQKNLRFICSIKLSKKNIILSFCIGIILHLMYKRWWHD